MAYDLKTACSVVYYYFLLINAIKHFFLNILYVLQQPRWHKCSRVPRSVHKQVMKDFFVPEFTVRDKYLLLLWTVIKSSVG